MNEETTFDWDWDEGIKNYEREASWLDELIDKSYKHSGNGVLSMVATVRYYSNLKKLNTE